MDLTMCHLSTGSDREAVVGDLSGLSTSQRALFFSFFPHLIPDINMWWFLLNYLLLLPLNRVLIK